MKNLKTSLIILFSVALMVAVMAVPAFATVYHTDTEASYVQNDTDSSYYTSTPITVTLDIQSKRTASSSPYTSYTKELDITLTPTSSQRFTVADVLIAANKLTNESISFQDYDGEELDYANDGSLPTYCYKAVLDGNTYAPTSRYAKNGWMFRINGKFPLDSGTPGVDAYGEAINTAYVKNNDVITFYMDNPGNTSYLALFSRIKEASYSSNVLTVTPQVSYNYFDNSLVWHINDYTLISGATVEVYSSKTSTSPLASATTSSSTGKASLSVSLTSGHTYYIRVQKSFYSGSKYIQTTRCLQAFTA